MYRFSISIFFIFASCLITWADVPMPHSGHISTAGAPYNQKGYFKFSILNATGETVWNHDGSSTLPPSGHLALDVVNGFYSLHLGDDSISGMSPLPAQTLRELEKASLRVWFSSEHNGTYQQVGVDLAMGAAPFALVSELSRGSPEIEDRLLIVENTLAKITARNIDPVLLMEMGYRKFSTRELVGFALPNLDLSSADFTNAIISDANLTNAKLDDIDLQGGQILDSNFSQASFITANLTNTTLENADLKAVKAKGISLSRAKGTAIDFSSSELSYSDLSDSLFIDCNFSNATLQGASILNSEFKNNEFKNASLVNLDSLNSDFSNCDFSGATISGYLTGANLKGANLSGADFSGSDLTGANLEGAIGFIPSAHSNVIYSGTTLPDGSSRTD